MEYNNSFIATNSTSNTLNNLVMPIFFFIVLLFGLFVVLRVLFMWPKAASVSQVANSNVPIANPKPVESPVQVSNVQVSSIEAELAKASDMLQKGLIDEEEYKALKKKIIDRS